MLHFVTLLAAVTAAAAQGCCFSNQFSVNLTETSTSWGLREGVVADVTQMILRADIEEQLTDGTMISEAVWTFGQGQYANQVVVFNYMENTCNAYPYTWVSPMVCINSSWTMVTTITVNSAKANVWIMGNQSYVVNANDCSPVLMLAPFNNFVNNTEAIFYNYMPSANPAAFVPCTPTSPGLKPITPKVEHVMHQIMKFFVF